MATLDDLTLAVRARVGDPTITELPDEHVERTLESARREFSRFRPKFGWTEFTTVVGQNDYALPATVFDVMELWTGPASYNGGDVFDPVFLLLMHDGPRSQATLMERLNRLGFTSVNDGFWKWQVNNKTHTLSVQPLPKHVLQVVARTQELVAFDELSAVDEEHIIRWAGALCLEYLAVRRNRPVVKVPTAVGTMQLDTGAHLFALSAEWKKEFRDALGGSATVVMQG